MRSKQDWLDQFERDLSQFKWFIVEHFEIEAIESLKLLHKNRDTKTMMVILSDIWLKLPDNKFNIIANPTGWNEFLNLIEFEDDVEYQQVTA